eukprot:maker-scaffold955_size76929-snap-gene-0.16 protein:Tk07423 transcript:maker-scaffold955_size76929-snap-gene-0.16-mRNA-1 annotation:"protein star-like"
MFRLVVFGHILCFNVCAVLSAEGYCDKTDVNCMPESFGAIDESLNSLEQDDPKLIQAIKGLLIPPSKEMYNLTQKSKVNFNGQYGQPEIIDKMYSNKLKKGFFIEAGAYDGEQISNSLRFEIFHQWTGLLIEPNPDAFSVLKTKNRRAWLLQSCFSTKTTPEIVEFDAAGLFGGIINPDNEHKPADFDIPKGADPDAWKTMLGYNRRTIRVQCFPFYSIMMALGNPTVHYFSLDIEGAEVPVLKTIPFDKVDIKILGIEANHIGEVFSGNHRDLKRMLKRAGYKYFRNIAIDEIWIKEDLEYNPEAEFMRGN